MNAQQRKELEQLIDQPIVPCILCNSKASWYAYVVHGDEDTIEPMCDKCYKAFNYGIEHELINHINRLVELKIEGQSKQEVA